VIREPKNASLLGKSCGTWAGPIPQAKPIERYERAASRSQSSSQSGQLDPNLGAIAKFCLFFRGGRLSSLPPLQYAEPLDPRSVEPFPTLLQSRMASAYRDARSLFAALRDMAEHLRLALIPLSDVERAKLVTKIVRESDLVYGVWPEENKDDGFGVQIMNGEAIMPPLESFERNDELRIAAIPCVGLQQALAAWGEWGRVDEPGEEMPESQIAATSALALAEAARLIWAASRNGG
jgi:hypothetical protein